MRRLALLLVLILAACDGQVGPTPVNIPLPTPNPAPPSEVVFNPGIPFAHGTRGILIFPAIQAAEDRIRALDARLRSLGWARPSYHVCAETADWEHTPWNDGPPAFSCENLENLDRFLRVTAELGSQVLLDVVCTIRDSSNFNRINEFAGIIASRVKNFDHVALHVANEHHHPSSNVRIVSQIRELRDTLRTAGFRGMIGTDDKATRHDMVYNPALAALGFWTDFHPWRVPGPPTRRQLQTMFDLNAAPHVISEPIAYSPDYDSENCCADSRALIKQHICDGEEVGFTMYYHSTDGLLWPDVDFEWIPGECSAS